MKASILSIVLSLSFSASLAGFQRRMIKLSRRQAAASSDKI